MTCLSVTSHYTAAIIDPTSSLGVTIVNSVCVSVCQNFKLLLLFCFSMESSHFWPPVLRDPLYKTPFFDFRFRPLTTKLYSPKFAQNRPYKSACMTDRREIFGPTREFPGMADSTVPCKMLWGRPLLPWQRNLG